VYLSRGLVKAANAILRLGLSQEGLSESSRFGLLTHLSRVEWVSGMLEQGLETIGEAIKCNPHSPAARWLQGLFHLRLGNPQKAIRSFGNCREREETGLFLDLAFSVAHFQKGDRELALNHLQAEERLQPQARALDTMKSSLQ